MAGSVNLIVVDNQAGLSRDMGIVCEVLRHDGIAVRVCAPSAHEAGPADANIFLEIPAPAYFPDSPVQVFIPNPEWWQGGWTPWLKRSNVIVFAKTRHGADVFKNLGARVSLVGFMSYDQQNPSVPKQRKFLHLAGKSATKGTAEIIEAWSRNPHFPTVVIVQNPSIQRQVPNQPNIILRAERISDEEVRRLQNECAFHLCPSRYEGFGHYIWEGLSTGALVLTTGAPPMNEAIQGQFGYLLRSSPGPRAGAIHTQHVSSLAIEEGVRNVMGFSDSQIAAMGRMARQSWEANAAAFRKRFVQLVLSL